MKKFLSEFKEFALRGNVLDMAIGVVIGGAFGKITTSLVNDVIMPLVGMLIGGIDLSQLDIVLKPAVMNGDEVVTAAVTLGIGTFLTQKYPHIGEGQRQRFHLVHLFHSYSTVLSAPHP